MWIFMEYCYYGDLNKYLTRHSESESGVVKILYQIASGLHYLHIKNIIHRDIKPNNILMQGAPNDANSVVVKLGDFGLSKFLGDDYVTSRMSSDLGTLPYKAPEFWKRRLNGHLDYHRNVDIFAFGLVILGIIQAEVINPLGERQYRIVSPSISGSMDPSTEDDNPIGQIMYERKKYNQTAVQLVISKPEDSETIKTIKNLIEGMCCPEPENRSSASAIVDELASLHHNLLQSSRCLHFEEKEGDLFSIPGDHSLASCISEDLNMDEGTITQFREKIKGCEEDLHYLRNKVGEVAVLENGNRYVYFLITKHVNTDTPTIENLRKAIHQMSIHCSQNGVQHLCMPRIGYGLDWNTVKYIICEVFGQIPINISAIIN